MLDTMHHDYIRTARAKGLKERIVVLRHGLRGALYPVVAYSPAGRHDQRVIYRRNDLFHSGPWNVFCELGIQPRLHARDGYSALLRRPDCFL